MPRTVRPSELPVGAVRRYFGLDQQTLAQYLGVSAGLLSQLESGKRTLTYAVEQRLQPLVALLPPPGSPPEAGAPAAPPVPAAGTPEAAPLARRLAECRHQAANLRYALADLAAPLTYAARWAAARPGLLAALPAPTPADLADAPPDSAAPGGRVAFGRWFARQWLLARPVALPPATAARYHLLRLRADALDYEAAVLAALLATG